MIFDLGDTKIGCAKRKGEIIESANIIVDASDEDKIVEIIKKTAEVFGLLVRIHINCYMNKHSL